MPLSAALWSKYPSGYVSSKIEPKLLERGILVKKHLSVRTKEMDLSDIDCVLFMHELSSHAEKNRLDIICKDKPVLSLSRKTSHWPRDLKPLAELLQTAKAADSKEAREKQIAIEQALDEIHLSHREAADEEFESVDDIVALESLYEEEVEKLRARVRELEAENKLLRELAVVVEQAMEEVKFKLKKKFEVFNDIITFYKANFVKSEL